VVAVRNLASDVVDLSGVRPAAEAPPNVLFMGDMRFETNRMGAAFLAREVWPRLDAELVRKLRPRLVLGGWAADTLVGDVIHADDPDMVVMPNVPEVSELFSQCQIVAVPVFFGGGSPHKMMEAAASGRPVICSRYAASTLEAIEESGFTVTDSASEVAKQIGALLRDSDLAGRRQRQASGWVKKHYSLDAWNRDMNDVGRALGIQEPLVA
jgi:glycosyltransferase involved in cell wall biosynthesis